MATEKYLFPFAGLQKLPATDGKPSHPGDKDRPATHRERLQRLPRVRSSREGAALRAGEPQGRWPEVGTLNPRREAGGRVHTHPQAAAPDPHVALFIYLLNWPGLDLSIFMCFLSFTVAS